MIHSLCYFSTADSSLGTNDFEELFEYVVTKNTSQEITGVLVYGQGNFMQIMEGPKKKIISIFNRIKEDNRHHNVIKVIEKDYPDRIFGKYDYGFKVVKDLTSLKELKNYITLLNNNPSKHTSKFISLIEHFLKNT
ncbi:BLUF domain-containing protein [Spongiivirga citrea]|uniref:BLUF domain-containing protein n=1 Tax=Spongiivirga citrea TaxID=1481457 RepID=A0A6M0CKD8_9FLAO|nr:BLUF domain-containing protein [Spongiivirga citrea]NER18311.1 hypothetical protein [Spongiivirga citrea]